MFKEAEVGYLRWIKALLREKPRISLLESGLSQPPADLGVDPAEMASEPSPLGAEPGVRARLSRRYQVPEAEVLPVLGTSQAVFLAMASVLRPGETVLVETPVYEPLRVVPRVLGAEVRLFPRRPAAGYGLEPDRIMAGWTPLTRLVVVSEPHNPTGRLAGDKALSQLAQAVAARGGFLLVDEVYRDFSPGKVQTARRLGEAVIAVSSLTKVYGLGSLRAGWVFAPPRSLNG